MNRWIRDLKKYYKYAVYASRSGLKAEVANSRLSWLWWILDPLLFMGVYWFLSQVIFGQRTRYYLVFVFVGLSMWDFFQKTILTNVKVVTNNTAIVTKIYIPKYVLVLIEMMKYLSRMGISFSLVFVMMLIYRVPLTWNIFYVFPIMLTLIMLVFGVSCIVAHLGVYVEDLQNVASVGMRLLFYISGVFYEIAPKLQTLSRIPHMLAEIMIRCNPVAFLLTECREVLIYGGTADLRLLGFWLLIGIILSVIGIRLIYKYESDYVKVL